MVNNRRLTANDYPFKLTSIVKEAPPAGAEGIGWHRYVITQGTNTIVGHTQGSADSVRLAAEEILVRVNERRLGKFRRVYPIPGIPAPKKRE